MCAPYNADIGLVGKAKSKYTIFLGGSRLGTRLGYIYKDSVPEEELVAEIANVLRRFQAQRQDGESLGDFCHRVGKEQLA